MKINQSDIIKAMKVANKINSVWNGENSWVDLNTHMAIYGNLQDIQMYLNINEKTAIDYVFKYVNFELNL